MNSTARARARETGGNLPADVTSFVGRRHEITLAKRLLGESRVVTLTGPGGVGKSRLALRVAHNVRRTFRDKAWHVELEELNDPTLLAGTVIEHLNLGDTSADSGVDTVIEHLRNREMLLVLDNCEHLIEECALFVDALIRSCPAVRVLTTSRQSLGIAGESTLVTPPLQVPDPEHLPPPEAYEQYASVRLLVDRARAVLPDFEPDADNGHVLMRLCHRLDGNPLAIELAVVRLRSMSPQQLEERLRERYDLLSEGRRGAPARQRSLRALIDWSYELCSEADRLAWAHVSVFSGSFTLEAAEHVAEPGDDTASVVHSLVDKSILLHEHADGESRYRLPHILREYGQEKLSAFGQRTEIEHRHRDWYAWLVGRFAAEWLGPEQVEWVQRLRRDQGNLRTALRSAAAESTAATVGLRMATRMGQYWGIRGLHGEARHWLDRMLASADAPRRERARALRLNGWFALLQGDTEAATPRLEEAANLAHYYGDEVEISHLEHTRGMAALFRGQSSIADDLINTALAGFRRHEVLDGELFALFGLGLARGLGRDHDAGIALLEECVERSTLLGEVFWRSYALWAIAHIELAHEAPNRAEITAKDALRLQRRMDNILATAFSIDTLARVAQCQGNNERAAKLFGAAANVWEAVRTAPTFYTVLEAERTEHVRQVRAALGDEEFESAHAQGYRMSKSSAIDFALETKKSSRQPGHDNVHPMPLTRREREIAELVTQGRTNKEIAEALVIAQRTVEGHVQHILTKLDFTSRAQIAGWIAAQQSGNPTE